MTAHTDSRHAHNKGRVFLWHKDTEMTPFDERVMSAAYIDERKVITTGKEGRCFTEGKMESSQTLTPFHKGFKGTVVRLEKRKFLVRGLQWW